MVSYVAQAFGILLRFLTELFFGILAAILYTIPWLLRAASLLGWFVAAFICITVALP